MIGGDALVLSPDVRVALQELAQASGQVFSVCDSQGRAAIVGNPRHSAGVWNGNTASTDEHEVPVRLGDGSWGHIRMAPRNGAWDSTQDAWLQSGACLLSSTLRMDTEVDGLAAEIAHTFEELFLLYSNSAALSLAEDHQAVCQAALSLALRHVRACPAAIYTCGDTDGRFLRCAWNGPKELWAPEVDPDSSSEQNSILSGQSVLRERAGAADLEAAGIRSSGGGFLCAPLGRDLGKTPSTLGWMVLYEPDESRPFLHSECNIARALAAQAGACAEKARSLQKKQHALLMGATRSLAAAVDVKDRYTYGHSLRVAGYALTIGRELGCTSTELQALELSGLLHDVGKIGIPDRVLSKAGFLDEEEWDLVRQHPVIGTSIVSEIPGLHPMVCEGIRSHHEWFNGWGYPDGLVGSEIPIAGRILSIADCFDAMTSDRPYRKGLNPETTIINMLEGDGKQFDPDVLVAFLNAYTFGGLSQPAPLKF